jgi:hypothetical protein
LTDTKHIDGYVHHRGVHCATAALRSVYEFVSGELLSESLIFGLGAGLNFTYAQFPDSPLWLTMGRGSYLEVNFCEAVGLGLVSHVFRDERAAIETVIDSVREDCPVIADTDMFLLPYMKSALDLPDQIHFGGHKVVITGYDREAKIAYVNDYAWQDKHRLSFKVLSDARTSAGSPSSPLNRVYILKPSPRRESLEYAILYALHKAVFLMLHPPMHYLGLNALDRFCRQLPNWPRLLGGRLAINRQVACFMMEKAGTGGGNYRRLFSRFLLESSVILGDSRFEKIARVYREAALSWTDLSKLLQPAPVEDLGQGWSDAKGVRLLTGDIWRLESQGVAELKELLP